MIKVTTTDRDDPVTLAWKNHEHGDVYEVQVFLAGDGVTVVQIDSPANVGRMRVKLDDELVFDGNPDSDKPPGAELAGDKGITLTRDQLDAWAGVHLTDDEVDRLTECIPNSSIPDAIYTIVTEVVDL